MDKTHSKGNSSGCRTNFKKAPRIMVEIHLLYLCSWCFRGIGSNREVVTVQLWRQTDKMFLILVDKFSYGIDVNWLVERDPIGTSNRVAYYKSVGSDLLCSIQYAVGAKSMTFSFCITQCEQCTHEIKILCWGWVHKVKLKEIIGRDRLNFGIKNMKFYYIHVLFWSTLILKAF